MATFTIDPAEATYANLMKAGGVQPPGWIVRRVGAVRATTDAGVVKTVDPTDPGVPTISPIHASKGSAVGHVRQPDSPKGPIGSSVASGAGLVREANSPKSSVQLSSAISSGLVRQANSPKSPIEPSNAVTGDYVVNTPT
jgi:hypothetical protein